jgi:hypothetical protein
MADRRSDGPSRAKRRDSTGRALSPRRLNELLNRLFTQDLRQDEAEAILAELVPVATELVSPLVNLLNSPDPHTRETASQVLIHLRPASASASVRVLLDRPGTSDATRLAAFTTLEVMGEAPDAERLLGWLNDPETLFERSLDDLLANLAHDQHACEFWQSLSGMERSTRLEMLQSIGERRDPQARKLLMAALWDEQSDVALAAVAALRDLRDPRAAESLLWLAEIARRQSVVEAARAAAVEIRVRSSARGDEPPPPAGIPECWASFIDGDGGQLLMAVRPVLPHAGSGRRCAGDRQRLASVFVSDQRGIVDASGSDTVTAAEAIALRQASSRTAVESCSGHDPGSLDGPDGVGGNGGHWPRSAGVRAETPEIGWVRVDSGYCEAAIDAARQINRRNHRRLPGAWEFWRDTFEGRDGDDTLALDDREGAPERLRRQLPQTGALIECEGFRSWLIQIHDLAPFLPTALRGIALRPQEREEHLAGAVTACLASVIKSRQRRAWRHRLQRQAALWQRRGDQIVSELCLAAAWGLDERSGVPTEEHPLLRAMMRASLEMAMGI